MKNNKIEDFDIYDTAMPLYIISKILGLAPFSLKGKRGKRKFIASIGAIELIRIILVIGGIGYVGYLLEESNLKFDIAGVAIRCELYLGSILTIIVLILATTNQNLIILAVKWIINIDKKMTNAGINIIYKNAKKFCLFQNMFIFSVFAMKGILQAFTSTSTTFQGVYAVLNLVDYINTIMLFQYTDFILLIRQRYIWLNRELNILQKIGDGNKLIYPNEFKIRKRPGLKFNGQNIDKYEDILEPSTILQSLGHIHNDLYDTGCVINRAYSIQLLLTTGIRFLMVTTQLLTTYKMAADKLNRSSFTYGLTAIYLTLHTLKVFMYASLSSNTADKARETAVRLHKIWECTPELKQNIHHFSLQILQQDINFTTGGFFILNYELMYNMLGALTTYLIILIQFDTAKQDTFSMCNDFLNGTLNKTIIKKTEDRTDD